MIVRNINDKAVVDSTFIAHGGGIARMLLDQRVLREIGFLAFGILPPGKKIEAHIDPVEEIYFILSGSTEIQVDEEKRVVGPGDATHIPAGSPHSLVNHGEEDCITLVIAAPIPRTAL